MLKNSSKLLKFHRISVVAGFLMTCSFARGVEPIAWRSGPAQAARRKAPEFRKVLTEAAALPARRHLVVQFATPVTPVERAELRARGVHLLKYLGNNGYFAAVSPTGLDADAVMRAKTFVEATTIRRAWKLDPRVQAGAVPSWAVVRSGSPPIRRAPLSGAPAPLLGSTAPAAETIVALYVLFHPDVPLATKAVKTAERHGAIVRDTLESVNGLVVELPLSNLNAFADEDIVQWIEWPLPRMSEVNDDVRLRTSADVVQAPPYNLDGSGITVLVYDAGTARASHQDFGQRLTVHDASFLDEHASHVACTVGGNGLASGGTYRGMAPGVTLLSYGLEYDWSEIFLYTNPGDLEHDYTEAMNSQGAAVGNNSIGTNVCWNDDFPCEITGNYGVTSVLIDSIVDGSLGAPFRVIWAAGNERGCNRCMLEGVHTREGYYSTAPPACAKNPIIVGAVNSDDDSMTYFSSWGPCDDGRVRPDIVAPGCQAEDGDSGDNPGVTSCSAAGDTEYTVMCGTSMAAPAVTGLSALLLEDFRARFPNRDDPLNSTIKALLAHNAVEHGPPGPDYMSGYGSVRIEPTVLLMQAGDFFEEEVGHNEVYRASALVSRGLPELKITLAWDDVAGTPNVRSALLNDLELVVYDPSGSRHFPWTLDPDHPDRPAVRTRADDVNNMEQVYTVLPTTNGAADAIWHVEVHGKRVASEKRQRFSLCASPSLTLCSAKGTVWLDRFEYACGHTAEAKVVDCDLNIAPGMVDTVKITVTSTSEPGGEAVVLHETEPDTGVFRGSIELSRINAPGVLLVADGDEITATYTDVDDGQGGVNMDLNTTAVLDCVGPCISNVLTTDVKPRSAVVEFTTDEFALSVIRYGTSCSALCEAAGLDDYVLEHQIALTGLEQDTSYFYTVEARDRVGNIHEDPGGGQCHSFITPGVPDYFTEDFSPDFAQELAPDNDLDHLSITFTPDGSPDFYCACVDGSITALPTDPSGGSVVSLSDDDYTVRSVTGGKEVALYGERYDSFFIGSNGYVTFDIGEDEYLESLDNHFSRSRVSPLFSDLNPARGGSVIWQEFDDRAVVTWNNVPGHGAENASTFQVELFFDSDDSPDGRIRFSYLSVEAEGGIVGLSHGLGVPAQFLETDLSAQPGCGVRQPGFPSPSALVRRTAVPAYVVEGVGTLGGQISNASALNAVGQVVGVAEDMLGKEHAFIWLPEPTYGLPCGIKEVNDGLPSEGTSIAKWGGVVVWGGVGPVGLWLPAPRYGWAAGLHYPAKLSVRAFKGYDINERAQMVGASWINAGGGKLRRGFAWLPYPDPDYELNARMNELPPFPGGTESWAMAINDDGQIVGRADGPDGEPRAVVWDLKVVGPGMQVLQPVDEDAESSLGRDINLYGWVAGEERIEPNYRPSFWGDGAVYDLGTLGGASGSATALNDWGQVVGTAQTTEGDWRAVLWHVPTITGPDGQLHVADGEPGVLVDDLNALIPAGSGWILREASDINANGQIVGKGINNKKGNHRAFLLTPVATVRSSTPVDGTIASYTDHPYGIGSPEDPIIIGLGAGGLSGLQHWDLCETGTGTLPGGENRSDANGILRVTETRAGTYEIVLDRPASTGQWTVIRLLRDGSGVSFASLEPAADTGGFVAKSGCYGDDHAEVGGKDLPEWKGAEARRGTLAQSRNCDPPENTCAIAEPPVVEGAGARYLAVTLPGIGANVEVAFRVTRNCPSSEDLAKYVGAPEDIADQGSFAVLVDSPVYLTRDEWGETVYVTGSAVVPSTLYTVQWKTEGAVYWSGPGRGTTWMWGDVDGNEVLNFTDIQLMVLAFKQNYTGLQRALAAADLEPISTYGVCSAPNHMINFGDIQWDVFVFQGRPYPHECQSCCVWGSPPS